MTATDAIRLIASQSWLLISRNKPDDFITDVLFHRAAIARMMRSVRISLRHVIAIHTGMVAEYYYAVPDLYRVCTHLVDSFIDNSTNIVTLPARVTKRAAALESLFAAFTYSSELRNLSNSSLWSLFAQRMEKQLQLYEVAWPLEIMQTPIIGLPERLDVIARNAGVAPQIIQVLARQLLTPQTRNVYEEEEEAVRRLGRELATHWIRSRSRTLNRWPSRFEAQLIAIWEKYRFLHYHGLLRRPPLSLARYRGRVIRAAMSPTSRPQLRPPRQQLQRDRDAAAAQIPPVVRRGWQWLARCEVAKARRRLAELRSFYFVDAILTEASRRRNVPVSQLRFLTPEELRRVMLGHRRAPSGTHMRIRRMIYMRSQGAEHLSHGPIAARLITALTHYVTSSPVDIAQPVITGTPIIGHGIYVGSAIVFDSTTYRRKTLSEVPFILVSQDLDPWIAVALTHCICILAEQGGATSHAAGIARSLNIPCVTGIQGLMVWARPGDLLEVNATTGIIRRVAYTVSKTE